MREEKVMLVNEIGLHSRKASRFIKEAIKFKSDIFVVKDNQEYNGKSIMGILSMGAFKGDEIVIRAIGVDEEEAVEALGKLHVINITELDIEEILNAYPKLTT